MHQPNVMRRAGVVLALLLGTALFAGPVAAEAAPRAQQASYAQQLPQQRSASVGSGTWLVQGHPAKAPESTTGKPKKSKKSKKKGFKAFGIVLLVIAIVFIVLVGLLIWYFVQRRNRRGH
ncbi:hypothetical protein [Streptomyces sp. NBC_00503]|uniref:hypothetical protein n=1 Tax=Streptomyces sp. NBC_00503 TaxID=2903659 RepID=UPI002E8214AF|nr:hypothetical protein [Streptomyces sp. NBC_00503]WUD83300.1 hypothetical protein OG490_23615 [Streptomyces sp. NBC_00503]